MYFICTGGECTGDDKFQCSNGRCIRQANVCDAYCDCVDQSLENKGSNSTCEDEQDCEEFYTFEHGTYVSMYVATLYVLRIRVVNGIIYKETRFQSTHTKYKRKAPITSVLRVLLYSIKEVIIVDSRNFRALKASEAIWRNFQK